MQSKEHKEKIRQAKLKDLTEKKFGRLSVVKQATERTNTGRVKWICICDCGNEHIVSGDCLTFGKTKSCGCLRREVQHLKFQDREHAVWKQLYNSTIVKRSKKGGYVTDIEFGLFKELSQCPCFYCGLVASNTVRDRNTTRDTVITYNGLDRVDSSGGYMKNNVVPCCKFCNCAKSTMSQEEFMRWVKRVYEFNLLGEASEVYCKMIEERINHVCTN